MSAAQPGPAGLLPRSKMCYSCGPVTRTVPLIPFLCALLPQLFLALFAPALVVCREADGTQVLELSVAGDCAPREQRPDATGQQVPHEECGDCEDAALTVSMKHHEEASQFAASLELVCFQGVSSPWAAGARPARAPSLSLAPPGTLATLRTVRLRC